MNLNAFIESEISRAAQQLRHAAELLEMLSIEADSDFDQRCAEAGIPASLARDAIDWISPGKQKGGRE